MKQEDPKVTKVIIFEKIKKSRAVSFLNEESITEMTSDYTRYGEDFVESIINTIYSLETGSRKEEDLVNGKENIATYLLKEVLYDFEASMITKKTISKLDAARDLLTSVEKKETIENAYPVSLEVRGLESMNVNKGDDSVKAGENLSKIESVEVADHTRKIRVRTVNADKMVQALKDEGYEAVFLGPGTHDTTFAGGCSDPNCCWQHSLPSDPDWGSIKTNASGRASHRIWVRYGIVSENK
jgi:hypothetical protein